MTFLNPAVLIGLIATAIPVLLHLLNLRKLKRIDFSTLAFLKELQKNKIRKIKLKQWLLLVLRTLIILLAVASFARPALQGLSIGGTTSSAKTTAVFIIDNTLSMSVISDKGSSFNRERQIIKSLLNELQEGDEAVVIPVAGIPGKEPGATTNISELRKQIDELDISPAEGTINNAVIKAAGFLGQSHNFNKEIYLLSDFQKNGILENDQAYSNLGELLNDKVKLYTFDFSGRDIYNLGIDRLELNNQILEKGKTIGFTALVTNYSTSRTAENSVVSLFINGVRSAQQSVSLQKGETRRIQFETTLKNSGYIDVTAGLEDDDILQDNKRSLSFNVPEKISVVLFSDNDENARFVDLALTAAAEGSSINLARRNLNQIPSVNLSNYDAVIVIGSPSAASDRLMSYMNSGGGIFLMPSGNDRLSDFAAISSKLHLPVPSALAGSASDMRTAAVFDRIDFEHPVFADLFQRTAKKQVESPEIFSYFKCSMQGQGKSLITLLDNSPFLSEYSSGKGRMLVMYSAPDLSWNSFPLKGLFAPLINKSVFYLSSKGSNVNDIYAGKEITLNLQNNTLPEVKIVRPDKNIEVINLNERNKFFFNYSNTSSLGNYKVFAGDRQINEFSVNPDPAESNLDAASKQAFAEYLKKVNFRGKQIPLDANDNYVKLIQQARFGSELWRYFLLGALILAFAEMYVARSTRKDMI
ncbi:MAG: BatA domain-containing protein [Syntrophothermus sp.]